MAFYYYAESFVFTPAIQVTYSTVGSGRLSINQFRFVLALPVFSKAPSQKSIVFSATYFKCVMVIYLYFAFNVKCNLQKNIFLFLFFYFTQVLKVDREPNQTDSKKIFITHLFIQKKDPVLHICQWQKHVNSCFQYLV